MSRRRSLRRAGHSRQNAALESIEDILASDPDPAAEFMIDAGIDATHAKLISAIAQAPGANDPAHKLVAAKLLVAAGITEAELDRIDEALT